MICAQQIQPSNIINVIISVCVSNVKLLQYSGIIFTSSTEPVEMFKVMSGCVSYIGLLIA